MPNVPADHGYPCLPPEECRCVWMTAGILSYQLCDRAFDCEHCALDQAMRKHFHPDAPCPALSEQSPDEGGGLPAGRRYSRGHCWVEMLPEAEAGAAVARVGLEPCLARALQHPRAVVQPQPRQRVQRGDAQVWIVMEGGTLPLASPASGILRRSNPALADRPHLVASRPCDEGWLYDLQLDPGLAAEEMSLLLDKAAAEHLYAHDARRFRTELLRALRAKTPNAPSLSDGGEPLTSASDMLGAQRYFGLLRLVYA